MVITHSNRKLIKNKCGKIVHYTQRELTSGTFLNKRL